MATTLQSRTIGGIVDQRVVLNNSEAKRLLTIGTDWTKIRIGLHLSCTAAANITGSPRIAFGLCSGVADGFGRLATTHFAGVRMSGTSFTYTAGPPAYLTASAAGAFLATKRVGNTNTDGAAVSSTAPIIVSTPTTNRSCLFIEVTKGSPNFTFQLGAPTTAGGAQTDITLAKFQEQMDWPAWSVSSITGWVTGYTIGSAINLAVSETDGNLTTLNYYWDQSSALMEFSDAEVSRLA